MRRVLSIVVLLVALPAWAAEPIAKVAGDKSADPGRVVTLNVTGSASDAETPLQVQVIGPGTPTTEILYDAERRPARLEVTPAVAGRYFLFVVATGKPDGASSPKVVVAPWVLEVGTPAPDPPPPPPPPPPVPIGDHDPAFVPLGRALAVQFGADYAAAVEDAARMLDAGQSRTMALGTVAKAFADARSRTFDRIVTPALDKVAPANVADKDLTPEQQKALAKAIRGLAKGAAGQ